MIIPPDVMVTILVNEIIAKIKKEEKEGRFYYYISATNWKFEVETIQPLTDYALHCIAQKIEDMGLV